MNTLETLIGYSTEDTDGDTPAEVFTCLACWHRPLAQPARPAPAGRAVTAAPGAGYLPVCNVCGRQPQV